MRRILLAVLFMAAFPGAAHASVSSAVSAGTLTITGDAADDFVALDRHRDAVASTPRASTAPRSRASSCATGAGADVVTVEPGVAPLIDGQAGTDTVARHRHRRVRGVHAAVLRRPRAGARDTEPGIVELAAVETLSVSTRGGADLVDIGDLTGSGVTRVDADLGPVRRRAGQPSPFRARTARTASGPRRSAPNCGDRHARRGAGRQRRPRDRPRRRRQRQAHGPQPLPGLTFDGGDGDDDLTGDGHDPARRAGNDRFKGGRRSAATPAPTACGVPAPAPTI